MPTQLDWYLQLNLKARNLRLLVAIDDLGSLKKVAEAMHVTLPAVSRALTELEKGLGLELFTRTQQGLRPTVYGECLIRHARGMLTDLQHVRDELNALSSGTGGKVNVGVYPASSSVLLPRALALLKERSPGTNAQVIENTSPVLLPQLWEGKIDLVVGRLESFRPSSGFEEKALLEEQLLVVTSPTHPLALRKRLQWADLNRFPWVLPPPVSQMREPLERWLVQNGIEVDKNYIETQSVHLIRAYLYLTDAISVMARAAASDKAQPLKVLPLELPRMLRSAGVLWNRNRPLSQAARLMIECLEDTAVKMGDEAAAT
ncbi:MULTISPECIES: LysR substrate-binding domain-containing protein [unclassified Caballeronia]|uniref:LysR substrate-binding domain-containing protein n=1 Tax=unclassified Caballeronia TaxID=2646786 RepID=UPI002027CF1B